MSTYVLRNAPGSSRAWPHWPLHLFLAVLFLGPIIAPLFRATGLPLISDAGVLAHDLLTLYVCPTPELSYFVLDLPMAVCARCWGATIGLLMARALPFDRLGWMAALRSGLLGLAWPVRLLLCALPFLLWALEIGGYAQGWWFPPLWLVLINGVQAGFAAGLFFCSVWPGLWPRPAANAV